MRICKDVIDSKHLCHDGTETQRVANGCQPRNQVAQENYRCLGGGWNDCEKYHKVENNGSKSNEIVQVGTDQPD